MFEFNDDLREKLTEHLQEMLNGGTKYEPHCQIPPEVLAEWDEMQKELHRVRSLTKAAEAKRQLFWHSPVLIG